MPSPCGSPFPEPATGSFAISGFIKRQRRGPYAQCQAHAAVLFPSLRQALLQDRAAGSPGDVFPPGRLGPCPARYEPHALPPRKKPNFAEASFPPPRRKREEFFPFSRGSPLFRRLCRGRRRGRTKSDLVFACIIVLFSGIVNCFTREFRNFRVFFCPPLRVLPLPAPARRSVPLFRPPAHVCGFPLPRPPPFVRPFRKPFLRTGAGLGSQKAAGPPVGAFPKRGASSQKKRPDGDGPFLVLFGKTPDPSRSRFLAFCAGLCYNSKKGFSPRRI